MAAVYAWIIDKDYLFNEDEPAHIICNDNQAGAQGPRLAPRTLLTDLGNGGGEEFRMKDDDGEVYYAGRIVGDYDGFEPLDDFGMPNAGCTIIEYMHPRTNDWLPL